MISHLKYEILGQFSVICQAELIFVVALSTSVEHMTCAAYKCFPVPCGKIANFTWCGGLQREVFIDQLCTGLNISDDRNSL